MTKFEDMYYDRQGILQALGIRVRRRGGNWQARKRSCSSSPVETKFFGRDEVAALVAEHLGNVKLGHGGAAGLDEIARFTTLKEVWQIERVKVTVESLDFGNVCGLARVTKELPDDASDEQEKDISSTLDDYLAAFMKIYGWAFPGHNEVQGKLSAFFAWKDAQQMSSSGCDILDTEI